MIRHTAIILTTLLLTVSSYTASSQAINKKKYKYNAVGGSIAILNYFGDLNPKPNFYNFNFRTTGVGLAAHYITKLTPRVTGRGQLQVGTIYGNDAKTKRSEEAIYRNRRNLSFKNTIVELKLDAQIHLHGHRRGIRHRRKWDLYGFAGIAGFYHNPKAKHDGKWYALQPLGTEGQNIDGVGVDGKYSRFGLAIPFGLGISYKYKTFWDIGFEVGMRYTFTDYLDDVSTNYVDKARFDTDDPAYYLSDRALEAATSEEEILFRNDVDPSRTEAYVNGYGRDGVKRGDANNDWYWSYNFTLTYYLLPRYQSPKFR